MGPRQFRVVEVGPIHYHLVHPFLEIFVETGTSIALFERAQDKVRVVDDIDLPEHVDWPGFVEEYRIGVELDPAPPGEF